MSALIAFGQPAGADDGDPFAGKPAKRDPLILKMYALGELAQPLRQFPFRPSLPAATSAAGAQGFGSAYGGVSGGLGGGGGIGLGGGGMSGGGQGLFSMPVSPQFGGAAGGFGAGGLGGGGFGGAVDFGVVNHTVVDSTDHHTSLIELLVAEIDTDSWVENGGQASIRAVNNTLIIRQTATNHESITEFLKVFTEKTVGGQPVAVELWWLPVNAGARRNMQKALADKNAITALNELCESVGGYHGMIKGRNRVTSHVCSGHRMPLVTGRVPVVGTEEVGYQPVVTHVNVGLFAEVQPRLQDAWEGDGVQVTFRTAMTTLPEQENAEDTSGEIDRFQFGSQVLEGNVVCDAGQPVAVGSLSAVGLFPDDDEDRELVLIVNVTK